MNVADQKFAPQALRNAVERVDDKVYVMKRAWRRFASTVPNVNFSSESPGQGPARGVVTGELAEGPFRPVVIGS